MKLTLISGAGCLTAWLAPAGRLVRRLISGAGRFGSFWRALSVCMGLGRRHPSPPTPEQQGAGLVGNLLKAEGAYAKSGMRVEYSVVGIWPAASGAADPYRCHVSPGPQLSIARAPLAARTARDIGSWPRLLQFDPCPGTGLEGSPTPPSILALDLS